MTWFKVDDSFYDHPKVFDAPDCALALWTRAGCWSARNLTDGFVPANLPARLCDDPDTAVKELVARGLWIRTKRGYQFHDWTTYQPTGDEVRDLRQKRADAGRKGGQAKAAKQTASKSQANARDVAKQNAAPSRPVPSRRDEGSVDLHPADRYARARDDDSKIDGQIIALLKALTSRDVSDAHAKQTRHRILDGRDVKDRSAYVIAAIRKAPADYLPAGRDPSTRTVEEALRAARGEP